jgi:hypothetical protein
MGMAPYTIVCLTPGCAHTARYKIAARWTDGITGELKTYALCCEDCLPAWFARSRMKQSACRLAPGELLDPPGIYLLQRGQRDHQLLPLDDLTKRLTMAEQRQGEPKRPQI